ncbi:MarC family protein [Cyanobium sp. HWJ4-Hawea]|uniref:MarC family protein n=1 Tax=Cyanobium sp. HWJ4-Hawea TaxID=2823713 RepID=UPI0020CF1E04|nr:MarC family protein [Cyanobium sp. HWJ4-Hawea]MCP9808208.1 MarC family protein [Cyanobium sp. HWJ4-Hawea]
MDNATFQHYLIGLLAIGNNVSSLGAYLAQTQSMPRQRILKVILITSLACFLFLAAFMLFGTAMLSFFGISISNFQIAGGLLLGGVGMEMMGASTHGPAAHKSVDITEQDTFPAALSNAVVPIGIPLTVGAGTASAVVLFADTAQRNGSGWSLLAAIVALVLINAVVFRFSNTIMRRLGPLVLTIFTKVMGLFTLSIGVDFVVNGVSTIYRGLMHS